ncbi:protein MAIN-LIKE 2-like [Arachis duranensis]|uniref:Protein MAIN-LIKE 2-like n=1 Tax=Arachis duranensis TaxID=130453 RepID=A0A9C6TLX3_ARADU|nr:protein MAIN-LIKE 2-like [Arachis hypogaea]XP_052116422.1 protein MAIN-LIKE 2-like [Arachis duranensis]
MDEEEEMGLSLWMLTCDYSVPPNRYNDKSKGGTQTHIFHLSIGECAVTLEDVAIILDLPMDGLSVTGMTMSSFDALEEECLYQFGVALRKSDCRGSCIKLTWIRDLKERLQLTDENSIQRYVKCHIMLLIGTILFGDKSGTFVHWKFLSLLRDFGSIRQYS